MTRSSPGPLSWTIRILAIAVILVGAWILWWARPVETAENAGIWFLGDLGGHPQAEPQAAFAMLCSSEKERLSESQFIESDFGDYAALAGGASGAASQYSGVETLRGDVRTAWMEYEVQAVDATETWRLNMIRERDWWEWTGDWKVCGIEFVAERPVDQ